MKLFENVSSLYRMTRYLRMKRPYRLEKPVTIQFPVIDICNSRCQMCRIWENHKSTDITPDQLRKGLRNPLYSEVTAVGLNGGEPTLRKDLGQLTEVLFEELPKLKAIALITNAYKTGEVIARITDVAAVVKRHGGFLDVMVSLDGYGEMHDRVRGKPGNFERAKKVLAFLKSCPEVGKIRIGCTIIKENVYGLADLFEFCQREDLYIKYRLGVPHQRLYTQDLRDPYALNFEEKYHVAEFLEGLIAHYETNPGQAFFYRSLIDQLVRDAPRKAGCDWQHRGATITAKGELLYCAVQSKVLGRIDEDDSQAIYFGNQAHQDDIFATHCDDCHHDYVGIPPKSVYARELAGLVAGRLGLPVPALAGLYRRAAGHPLRLRNRYRRILARARARAGDPLPWPEAGGAPVPGRPRVLVCGWYGTETLGDKGILAGIAESLRAHLGEIDLAVVSLHSYISEMTRRQMAELSGMTILTREEGVRIAGSADLVAFGGGPIMALDELADMQAIFEAAKAKGVATLIAGAGVGPLGEPWHNRSIARILQLADARIYRDAKSREAARRLGVDVAEDPVAEDPAFTWLAAIRHRLATEAAAGVVPAPVLSPGFVPVAPAAIPARARRPAGALAGTGAGTGTGLAAAAEAAGAPAGRAGAARAGTAEEKLPDGQTPGRETAGLEAADLETAGGELAGPDRAAAEGTGEPAAPPRVLLLGLRDFPWQAYARGLSRADCLAARDRFEAAVLTTLETLAARHPDLVIRPLPMCTNHFGDDDRWFYRRLFRGRPALAPRLDLSLLGGEMAPEAYARAFRAADAALCMRFHSLVFALGLEVPAFAIDYTLGKGKVGALAERFAVPHQSLVALEAGTMTEALEELLARGCPQAPDHAPLFPGALAAVLARIGPRGRLGIATGDQVPADAAPALTGDAAGSARAQEPMAAEAAGGAGDPAGGRSIGGTAGGTAGRSGGQAA